MASSKRNYPIVHNLYKILYTPFHDVFYHRHPRRGAKYSANFRGCFLTKLLNLHEISISLATTNSPPSPLSLSLSRFELTVLSNQRKAEHGRGNNRHERHRRINAKGQDTTRSGIIGVQVRSVNAAYRGQGIVRRDGRGSLCKGPVDYVRGLYYFYFLLGLMLYCYFEQ